MKNLKTFSYRILCLLLCLSMVIPGISAFAEDSVTVAFIGNTQLKDKQMTPYTSVVTTYLESRLGKEVNLVTGKPVDFDAADFMNSLVNDVASKNPDMVFIELDVSKVYASKDAKLTEKLDAMVKELAKNGNPAVYFFYTPQATLRDNRAPFDKVAKHYSIKTIDVFSYFKEQFKNGSWRTKDFLTAGVIPAERAHEKIGELIVHDLKTMDNLLASKLSSTKPLTDAVYTAVNEAASEEVAPKTEGLILYVSVKDGKDGALGTIDKPIKSLEEARQRIRDAKKKQGADFKGATVYLREGLYVVGESFELTKEDSGTDTAGVVYQGYGDEEVRITNANLLDPNKFKKVTDIDVLEKLPTQSAAKVYEYDFRPEGINVGSFLRMATYAGGKERTTYSSDKSVSLGNLLIANGKMQQRSRYPNGGHALVASHVTGTKTEIPYQINNKEKWANIGPTATVETMTALSMAYFSEHNKVINIDTKNRMITLGGPVCSGGVIEGGYWILWDTLEELDIPREWFADPNTKKLYYYPEGDIKETEVLFSSNYNPVIRMTETKNITFRNVTVEGSSEDGIQIIDGNNNLVERCVIRNLGHFGVVIENTTGKKGPGNNAVKSCHVYETATGGVLIKGGDMENLTPSGDYVENCHFENYAAAIHCGTGAIASDSTVGVRYLHNTAHNDDTPAVYMGGNDDYYEYNELYNVCRETSDYATMYGDHRGSMRQGVTVLHNYFHDVWSDPGFGNLKAFYSDSHRNNGATVSNNVFYNQMSGVYFSDNQHMTAEENLFIDPMIDCIRGVDGWYDDAQDVHDEAFFREMEEKENYLMPEYRGIGEKAFNAATGVNVLFYRWYLEELNFTEDTKNAYYLKYPWIEHALTSHPNTGGWNFIRHNVGFGEDARVNFMKMPHGHDHTIEENYMRLEPIPENDDVYKRIEEGFKIATEKFEDFEVWDVRKAGIYDDPTPVGAFSLLSPVNDSTGVLVDDLYLTWENASGADEYEAVVATDPEFKNIVFKENTRVNSIKVEGLSTGARKYYWKARAISYSDQFTGSPYSEEVYSFTTSRFAIGDKYNLGLLYEMATTLLEGMVEGTGDGEYPVGIKANLQAALEPAKKAFEYERATQEEVDDAYERLNTAYLEALAQVNIGESTVDEILSDPSNVVAAYNKGISTMPGVTFENGGIQLKQKGIVFTKDKLPANQIFRGNYKFKMAKGAYSMFGLRGDDTNGEYSYYIDTYVFLVSEDAIEVQAFRPVNPLYLTMPNDGIIRDGELHDIEFAALTVDHGNAVRLILRVDGKILFDHTETENAMKNGGHASLFTSKKEMEVEVYAPEEQEYPSLKELLEDPESELNKK